MTTIAFDARKMIDQLKRFGTANSSFLLAGREPFDGLARRLEVAMASKHPEFRWGTKVHGADQPITTIASKCWKGEGHHGPIHASFLFGWQCRRPDLNSNRLLVANGATEISFIDASITGKSSSTCFHFDLCEGGSDLGSGHPMFHTQFVGAVPDIPRLPSFLVHPVDAMEWALMDCFQLRWRTHIKATETRSALGGHATAQHYRVSSTLNHWQKRVDADRSYPLLAFQSRIVSPLDLDAPKK